MYKKIHKVHKNLSVFWPSKKAEIIADDDVFFTQGCKAYEKIGEQ